MINEEGGIDPEQFRMEAMFDRMDAIGKGILGLTIQCAQCHTPQVRPDHAGRVLPDVRLPQQHARGEHRGLRAGRAEASGPRSSARSTTRKTKLQRRPPRLGRPDGARGRTPSAARDRRGRSSAPTSTPTTAAARSTTCSTTARSSPPATLPTLHTTQFTALEPVPERRGGPAGTAQRPEPAAVAAPAGRSRACSR